MDQETLDFLAGCDLETFIGFLLEYLQSRTILNERETTFVKESIEIMMENI